MTPKEILIAARAKIADPKNWTQHAFARDADAEPTPSTSLIYPDAVCFCAIGAVRYVVANAMPTFEGLSEQKRIALQLLARVMGRDVEDYNDSHTHAEVLAKFDEAIGAAS